MTNAWLKDAISKAAETVEFVLVGVDEMGTKILGILEDLDTMFDRVLNDEQAQPAPQSGPVEGVPLETMIDYIYNKTIESGRQFGFTEDQFKSALRSAPFLTESTYERYKMHEKNQGR